MNSIELAATTSASKKLKWWQVALISVAVSTLGGLSALMSSKKQKKVYNTQFKQAPWSPPAWAFAPAWTINNFFLINAMRSQVNIRESGMLARNRPRGLRVSNQIHLQRLAQIRS